MYFEFILDFAPHPAKENIEPSHFRSICLSQLYAFM